MPIYILIYFSTLPIGICTITNDPQNFKTHAQYIVFFNVFLFLFSFYVYKDIDIQKTKTHTPDILPHTKTTI